MKQNFVRQGETCRALPRYFARHTGGGFSPLRLVAGKAPWQTARYACRLARCACRSSFPKISLRCDFREPCIFSGHTIYKTRGAFTSIQTKPKQKGPALKGDFCAPCGSSSLQYRSGYCCFVYRPNSSQNASFQGAEQSKAGRLPQMQGKVRSQYNDVLARALTKQMW